MTIRLKLDERNMVFICQLKALAGNMYEFYQPNLSKYLAAWSPQ